MDMLELESITRYFGKNKVLDGLCMHVPPGRIYGFLGRNGAGKTTTIRIILGLIRSHGGSIRVNGKRMIPSRVSEIGRIGSIVEFPGFYPNLEGSDNLKVFQWLHGIEDPRAIPRALDLVGLSRVGGQRVGSYSLGMKQRLGIARAMLHDPDILILDEPTNGLDPSGMREIRALLKSLARDRGKTVFLSSHILSEIEQIVDVVGILKHGTMHEEVAIEELQRRCRRGTKVRTTQRDRAMVFLRDKGIDCRADGVDGLVVADGADAAFVNGLLVGSGFAVSMLRESSRSLEEYFLEATA